MRGAASPNHEYILRAVCQLTAATPAPRILDFGCGHGVLIAKGRAAGIEFWGADAYATKYAAWQEHIDPTARPFIKRNEEGRIPYPDGHFDAAVSNQVFEHIAWPDLTTAMREICRVLKPGGALLTLFPTADVWFEGHMGIYFPHRLRRWPAVQRAYLSACFALGFGYRRKGTAADWATAKHRLLETNVFHHSKQAFTDLAGGVFGSRPRSLAPDYMRFRLAPYGRLVGLTEAPILDGLLSFICHKRAGQVCVVNRQR
jgi:SAM-dependent methyltransferase